MTRDVTVMYHLLDPRNWGSVQRHGLLSAQRLMEASGEAPEQAAVHRPEGRVLGFEGAFIRNQRPMPPAVLARCLRDGVTPAAWFQLLNSKVFFWPDPARLNRHRLACRDEAQIVLVVDAARLLRVHGARAAVTPFNAGNALRRAAPRNLSSFVPYERWRQEGWADERVSGCPPRPATHRPAELVVADAVPDAMTYVQDVIYLSPGELLP